MDGTPDIFYSPGPGLKPTILTLSAPARRILTSEFDVLSAIEAYRNLMPGSAYYGKKT